VARPLGVGVELSTLTILVATNGCGQGTGDEPPVELVDVLAVIPPPDEALEDEVLELEEAPPRAVPPPEPPIFSAAGSTHVAAPIGPRAVSTASVYLVRPTSLQRRA
jgi:hypothetical protein